MLLSEHESAIISTLLHPEDAVPDLELGRDSSLPEEPACGFARERNALFRSDGPDKGVRLLQTGDAARVHQIIST